MNNLFYENASVLIIGNEILSGRTIDKNFNYIATKLGEHGISISESRTVSDSEEEIINAIGNENAASLAEKRAEDEFISDYWVGNLGLLCICSSTKRSRGFQCELRFTISRSWYSFQRIAWCIDP